MLGLQCCISYFLKVTHYSYKLLMQNSNTLQLVITEKSNELQLLRYFCSITIQHCWPYVINQA